MKVLITGGAGFIGCNAASRYLRRGYSVVVLDNLSRIGGERNIEWLRVQGDLTFAKVNICDAAQVNKVFEQHADTNLVLHLAGQVAVTTSVVDPRLDFEGNALGTFNVLEAARTNNIEAPFIFSSTNKVYGEMDGAQIVERNGRYDYANLPRGVSEEQGLDFHSPYGCSKGAADQYVRDYNRIYGLRTIVFRQSCIYGYRQFGVEDQGWVAWFTIATQLERPITVYGDGKQVRDLLFIDDLLDAYDAAAANIQTTAGQIYNVGGGTENVLSLIELLDYLKRAEQRDIPFQYDDWRPGDQRVYISDIGRAQKELSWSPKIDVRQGLDLLYKWVAENKGLFQ
jgi:CDP-paratose 2-epimerase